MTATGIDPTPLLKFFTGIPSPEVARHLEVEQSTVRRWRLGNRRISLHRAERIVINRLGLHPANVWGDAWWDALGDQP